MKHDEFIGHVQHRARLDSRGAAERATRATLEALRQRLAGGAPGNLGAQLPQEIGRHLDGEGGGERFDVREFYERVRTAEGESVDYPEAVFHARAVMSVVRDAVTGGQFDDIVTQLPDEYSDVFDWDDATTAS